MQTLPRWLPLSTRAYGGHEAPSGGSEPPSQAVSSAPDGRWPTKRSQTGGRTHHDHPGGPQDGHEPRRPAGLGRRGRRTDHPGRVYWVDGSDEEWDRLTTELVEAGTFTRLNGTASRTPSAPLPTRRTSPASRSAPSSAPTTRRTPASPTTGVAGRDEGDPHRPVRGLHDRSHDVRHPVRHGPHRCRRPEYGVPVTDSAYVAVSMKIMTRIGTPVLRASRGTMPVSSSACTRSASPFADGEADVAWPCSDTKYIAHFPDTREIWSYGSGYGGNSLLGKKCYSLRIASVMARDEGGWPSTCSSSSSPRPPAPPITSLGPSRQRLREDESRDAPPDDRGLDRRDGR